ncbi:lipase 3-like [Leptopilina boulardi]|uniref:lipase 3-like n=1 Tax=Leptopilina boulardi TaxID=63433 RepID=UPI0021F50F98|nr:lipase 3-like [Leptopilina boulardi]
MCYFLCKIKIFIVFLQLLILQSNLISCEFPNTDKKIRYLVNDDGYPFEEYELKTQDGYILKIHRIPGGCDKKCYKNEKNKPIVFLLHPLTQSSISWIMDGPKISLAYLLADKGFDVWLGNNRGTIYGRDHETLMPTSTKFWNFSWHECGIYDLPETIDFILQKTKRKKLFFICYSQSCTELFVMGSLMPKYNEKISLAVNLAPLVFAGNVKGINWPLGFIFAYLSGIFESTGHFDLTSSPLSSIISISLFNNRITRFLLFSLLKDSIYGFSQNDMDMTILKKNLFLFPGGCSTKMFVHFLFGIINPGTFRQYDYGKEENLRKYGSLIPPDYPLGNVTVPMAIFSGFRDFLATPSDIELLLKELPNVVYRHVEFSFNHADFALANRNVRKIIYNKIIELFLNMKIFSSFNICTKSETFKGLVENGESKIFFNSPIRNCIFSSYT